MPFIKMYVNEDTGVSYPESFWWPASFAVNYQERSIIVTYIAHLSQLHQAQGFQPLPYKRQYVISGNAFLAFIRELFTASTDDRLPLPIEIAKLLDTVALSYKDTVGPSAELVSFFADARRVDAVLDQTFVRQ